MKKVFAYLIFTLLDIYKLALRNKYLISRKIFTIQRVDFFTRFIHKIKRHSLITHKQKVPTDKFFMNFNFSPSSQPIRIINDKSATK